MQIFGRNLNLGFPGLGHLFQSAAGPIDFCEDKLFSAKKFLERLGEKNG
jgi:hypothetical protein